MRHLFRIFGKPTSKRIMRRKLLCTIGYNDDGQLVHIRDTQKGEIYRCPQCGGRIVPHNSGKDGKGSKRPHFSHLKKPELKCTGESVLRHVFREKAVQILQHRLDAQKAFDLHWACNYCSQLYSKNLLKRTATIATQTSIEGHTPDILLLNKHGKPVIGIEIVVRQKLTRKVIHRYETQGILLIEIHPTEKDLHAVEEKLSHPDKVGFCSNAECYNSQFYQHTIGRTVFNQPLKCKTCGKVVEGYMVKSDSALGAIRLENLSEEEKKEIVRKHFRGKKVTVADFVVYGKCKCKPYSKSLQYVKKKP